MKNESIEGCGAGGIDIEYAGHQFPVSTSCDGPFEHCAEERRCIGVLQRKSLYVLFDDPLFLFGNDHRYLSFPSQGL